MSLWLLVMSGPILYSGTIIFPSDTNEPTAIMVTSFIPTGVFLVTKYQHSISYQNFWDFTVNILSCNILVRLSYLISEICLKLGIPRTSASISCKAYLYRMIQI